MRRLKFCHLWKIQLVIWWFISPHLTLPLSIAFLGSFAGRRRDGAGGMFTRHGAGQRQVARDSGRGRAEVGRSSSQRPQRRKSPAEPRQRMNAILWEIITKRRTLWAAFALFSTNCQVQRYSLSQSPIRFSSDPPVHLFLFLFSIVLGQDDS